MTEPAKREEPAVARPRILPPVWLALTLVAMGLAHYYLPIVRIAESSWRLVGIAPILAGILMAAISAGAFSRAGTPVIPFHPSTALVETGFYRFTRNPMYLGMVLVLVGVAILSGTLGAWLPVPVFIAVIHYRFILGEERFLTSIFGEDYERYRTRVRRWL